MDTPTQSALGHATLDRLVVPLSRSVRPSHSHSIRSLIVTAQARLVRTRTHMSIEVIMCASCVFELQQSTPVSDRGSIWLGVTEPINRTNLLMHPALWFR